MDKTINQKAWFLVLPVFLVVAFSAILPLMTVVNQSSRDTSAPMSDEVSTPEPSLSTLFTAVTRPVEPSTSIIAPSGIRFVAFNTETTQGMP